MEELAATLGIHPSTVSRALDPARSHLVAATTRERISEAATAAGYRPNPTAAGLRRGRTMTVGVLTPDLGNLTIVEAIRALGEVLDRQDLTPLIAESMDDPTSHRPPDRALPGPQRRRDRLARRDRGRSRGARSHGDPRSRSCWPCASSTTAGCRRCAATTTSGHRWRPATSPTSGTSRVAQVQGPQRSQLFADRARGFAETATRRGLRIRRTRYIADHATAVEGRRLATALIDAAGDQLPDSGVRPQRCAGARRLLGAPGPWAALSRRRLHRRVQRGDADQRHGDRVDVGELSEPGDRPSNRRDRARAHRRNTAHGCHRGVRARLVVRASTGPPRA